MMHTHIDRFHAACEAHPIVAILRGISPDEVCDVADVLIESGFRIIEVPLNSPEPEKSIEKLSSHVDRTVIVGAGTVLDVTAVHRVQAAGGQLVVAPNIDSDVVMAATQLGMVTMPGVATPTEAFTAIRAGATALKLFPSDAASPVTIKAWRAVLPESVPVFAVGGVQTNTLADWWTAGAGGFGIGSALYKPGISLTELRTRAEAFTTAFVRLKSH